MIIKFIETTTNSFVDNICAVLLILFMIGELIICIKCILITRKERLEQEQIEEEKRREKCEKDLR